MEAQEFAEQFIKSWEKAHEPQIKRLYHAIDVLQHEIKILEWNTEVLKTGVGKPIRTSTKNKTKPRMKK